MERISALKAATKRGKKTKEEKATLNKKYYELHL